MQVHRHVEPAVARLPKFRYVVRPVQKVVLIIAILCVVFVGQAGKVYFVRTISSPCFFKNKSLEI
jgi:hypothetical protein